MTTKEEVIKYLKQRGVYVPSWLDTPLIVWGDKTARQFAKDTSWDEVMGTLRRIYG